MKSIAQDVFKWWAFYPDFNEGKNDLMSLMETSLQLSINLSNQAKFLLSDWDFPRSCQNFSANLGWGAFWKIYRNDVSNELVEPFFANVFSAWWNSIKSWGSIALFQGDLSRPPSPCQINVAVAVVSSEITTNPFSWLFANI